MRLGGGRMTRPFLAVMPAPNLQAKSSAIQHQDLFLRRSCAGFIFTLDIILRFNTAYEPSDKHHEGDLVTSRWKIGGRYLRTSFWLDFFSIVPAHLEVCATSSRWMISL